MTTPRDHFHQRFHAGLLRNRLQQFLAGNEASLPKLKFLFVVYKAKRAASQLRNGNEA